MKKIIVTLIAIAAISASFAMPTILGSTGGYDVPNAYVAERTTISVNYVFNNDEDLGKDVYPSVAVTFPAGDITEIYASYKQADATFTSIGAKVAIPINFFSTDLAVGVGYAQASAVNELSGYAAVSKDICGVVTTMQVAYFSDGNKQEELVWKFNLDKAVTSKVNVGVDLGLGNQYFSVADQYNGTANTSYVNAYARVAFAEQFEAQFVAANIAQDAKFALGGAYKF